MGKAARIQGPVDRNTIALIGASLLSAAGSLPMHLMPLTGIWLLTIARTGFRNTLRPRFFALGLVLGFSLIVISYTGHWSGFFVGLIAFEIAFNTLAARLQGAVAMAAPQFTGRWLTAAFLLGAASGPPLNGAAISAEAGPYFIGFAVLSALLPGLWARVYSGRLNDRQSG